MSEGTPTGRNPQRDHEREKPQEPEKNASKAPFPGSLFRHALSLRAAVKLRFPRSFSGGPRTMR
jgi:hypothetical protein